MAFYNVGQVRVGGSPVETWRTAAGSTYTAYEYEGKEVVVHDDDDEVVSVFGTEDGYTIVYYLCPRDAINFVRFNAKAFIRGRFRYAGKDAGAIELLNAMGVDVGVQEA